MILSIILAIIVFVVCIVSCIQDKDDIWLTIIFTLTGLIAVGLISWGLFSIPNIFISKEEKEYSKVSHKIISLKDNKEIKGTFILGSGYIGGELYYYYFEETSEGLKKKELKASDCYIKCDSKPRVIKYTHTGFKKKYHYIYTIPAVGETYYVIYVPKGSITNEFKIDLE